MRIRHRKNRKVRCSAGAKAYLASSLILLKYGYKGFQKIMAKTEEAR